jgi:hypothetical protein
MSNQKGMSDQKRMGNLVGDSDRITQPLAATMAVVGVISRNLEAQNSNQNSNLGLKPESNLKPNPKSKYEMTKYLNDVMDGEPNLVRVSHSTPMSDLFPHAPLILTVTGTVLLESIFIGKPVACLGTHSMRNYPGVTPIEAPEDVSMVLANVMDGHACSASHVQALALLQRLHATSYSATIWDPVRQPHQGTDATIDALTTAFASVLKELK